MSRNPTGNIFLSWIDGRGGDEGVAEDYFILFIIIIFFFLKKKQCKRTINKSAASLWKTVFRKVRSD